MFHDDELTILATRESCRIEEDEERVVVHGLPGVASDGRIVLTDIRKSKAGGTESPGTTEGAVHAIEISTRGVGNGWLHEADGTVLGNQLGDSPGGWKRISIGNTHGRTESARELLGRYGRHIIGAAAAKEAGAVGRGEKTLGEIAAESYRIRANVGGVERSASRQAVAVLGAGGTGSHVIDLLVRTQVKRIVVVDDDTMELKNVMRCPGGITHEEMSRIHAGGVRKSEYHVKTRKAFPTEVIARNTLASRATGAELKEGGVTFAFVCMGQKAGAEQGRQDDVYEGLMEVGIPFIDTGISLAIEGGVLRGSVTTIKCAGGSDTWKVDIPNAGLKGGEALYHNVQVPEINAIAAAFAILEWRRVTNQYRDEQEESRIAKYLVEENAIRTGGRGGP